MWTVVYELPVFQLFLLGQGETALENRTATSEVLYEKFEFQLSCILF